MTDTRSEEHRDGSKVRRWLGAARRADARPGIVSAAARLRRLLPGDDRYGGDPLSTAGDEATQRVGRTVAGLATERPSALREVGLGALQVWQSIAEAQGRGRGERELTLLFTDLVGFSSWALESGDTAAVELLREVACAAEGAVEEHGGEVVKRLGDGLMAVFTSPRDAVAAAQAAHAAVAEIERDGHTPRMRAGIHVGRPRKLGGDYLGVDVNIAARVAEAAKPGETLLSDAACAALDEVETGRARRLRADGTPKGSRVHPVAQAA